MGGQRTGHQCMRSPCFEPWQSQPQPLSREEQEAMLCRCCGAAFLISSASAAPCECAGSISEAVPRRPPLSALLEGERRSVRAPGWLAEKSPPQKCSRADTWGCPRTWQGGREGRLTSVNCTGIKKQRPCASWLGGSEVQREKDDFVWWVCHLAGRGWLVIAAF